MICVTINLQLVLPTLPCTQITNGLVRRITRRAHDALTDKYREKKTFLSILYSKKKQNLSLQHDSITDDLFLYRKRTHSQTLFDTNSSYFYRLLLSLTLYNIDLKVSHYILMVCSYIQYITYNDTSKNKQVRFHFSFSSIAMLRFFYDSLETVKKITYPKTSEFINLSIAIFIAVIISGAFFAATDSVIYSLLRLIYATMRWNPAELLE